MRVNIAKWGNSAAIRLPKAVMEGLKLRPGSQLDLTLEGGVVKLVAAPERQRLSLADLLAECDRIGWREQPGLEDWVGAEPEWPQWDVKSEGTKGVA